MNFAVIFDMDGVIIDSNPYHKLGWKMFCSKHDIVLDEKEWEDKIFGRTGAVSLPIIMQKELTPHEIKIYCDEINSNFRKSAENIQPLKGLKAFLDLLTKADIQFAMATSAPPENVEFVLNKTGLKNYFKFIVDDTQISKSKPDPEVFLKAADKLNTPPNKCIVFEDSLSGIQAAFSAGMKIVGVTTTHTAANLNNTDLIIDDFENLALKDIEVLLQN